LESHCYLAEDRGKSFYFDEYEKQDGEWIDINEPICTIRVGEREPLQFSAVMCKAKKAGVLEWTSKENEELTNGKVFYRLHPKGEYRNENSIENSEFKEYFKSTDFRSFEKWLVSDGDYLEIGKPVFQFYDEKFQRHINHSKKAGFVHQIDPAKIVDLEAGELMYVIRESDEIRVNERFVNKPNIIKDEFTSSTIITWEKVSSRFERSSGIKTKSDNLITDFLFSFNYIDNNDCIVFQFDPKQIRPKQFDKVNFLFENGEQIQFELTENPVSSKKRSNETVLDYRGVITKAELELFKNSNFKKWKISLVGDKREVLGGEIGGDDFYASMDNIQIVIKKFAAEYVDLVTKTIPNYQPTELKQTEPTNETTTDFCFVYLMHDTSNGYYKIGISNNPGYRERTLQSEKPTIEMITSKKFPIRKIAESIEKALHDTYSEKRLRGEWFELDDKDIEHIKETLK
jgi:hypothetical protein